ncbi:MAG: hypothetical protein BWK80_27995 [Desulfobacteraceae bacterium IS3]|nr:MAG: hypothetical protein BWK80_27995 [Desulfobacteraceae bacterium IS3]
MEKTEKDDVLIFYLVHARRVGMWPGLSASDDVGASPLWLPFAGGKGKHGGLPLWFPVPKEDVVLKKMYKKSYFALSE